MSCERTLEALPWLAAGSLEGAEAAALREHLEGCEACRAESAEVLDVLGAYGIHPSIEDLLDRVEGRPTPEWVDLHLEHCADCREQLDLVQRSLHEIESEGQVVSLLASEGAAEVERGAVEGVGSGRSRRTSTRSESPPGASPALWRGLAVAASLVAAIGMIGWFRAMDRAARELAELRDEMAQLAEARVSESQRAEDMIADRGDLAAALADAEAKLRRTRDDLRRRIEMPRLGVVVHDLLPRSLTLRSGGGQEDGAVDRSVETAVFRLTVFEELPEGQLILELRAGNEVLWVGEEPQVSATGDVTVTVPAAFLRLGDMEWVIRREDGGDVEAFPFRVVESIESR